MLAFRTILNFNVNGLRRTGRDKFVRSINTQDILAFDEARDALSPSVDCINEITSDIVRIFTNALATTVYQKEI